MIADLQIVVGVTVWALFLLSVFGIAGLVVFRTIRRLVGWIRKS